MTFKNDSDGIYYTAGDFTKFKYHLDSINYEIEFSGMDSSNFFSRSKIFHYSICFNNTGKTLVLKTEKNVEFFLRQ